MALSEEVVQEYRTSLKDLNVNSKPLINMLTMLADDNEQHAPFIVEVIEDHITKCRPEKKLPVLYLIDSIMKNLPKSSYRSLFARNLVTTFAGVFEKVDEKTRAAMYKLRQTWVEIVESSRLYKIDVQIHNTMDPAWPITAPVPEPARTSIHVNPKFLAKTSSDSDRSSPEIVLEEEEEEEEEVEEEVVEDTDDLEDQETLLRKQLIAKQQELLRIKQASLELELAETEEQMRKQKKSKKQTTKSTAVPAAHKASVKHQLSPKSAMGMELPVAPRDPRLAAGSVPRDPRLARSSIASSGHPAVLSNSLVSSSLSSVMPHSPATSMYPGYPQVVGSPPYASSVNGLPGHQPGAVYCGPAEAFTGEVYNSPDSGARFSDDSESSRSSWQEIRNIPQPPQKKANTRDPRFLKKAQEEPKAPHNDSHTRRHHATDSSKHPHGNSSYHGNSTKQHTSHHQAETYKHHQHHHQDAARSHQHSSNVEKYSEDKVQRHSNSAKDFKRETKEHDRSSKERERVSNSKERDRVSKDKGRVSKERDSVSPRNSSSHSSLSHSKSADNVRENKDISKHKSIPERRKQSDTSNASKVSPSKGNSSLRSSSKTNVADRGRNSSNKGRDNNTDKIPKKSSSSPNLQRNEKEKNKDKKIRNEDVKKKDTRTIKESVGKANVEKKPEKSKSDSVVVGSKVKVKTEIKEEKMDVEEQEPSVPKSPETPVEKGEKRSSETENTPRVVKKLKIEIDVANDNNNLTRVKTEKMETEDSKTSVASDISALFGSEDQDYRSADQKTPLPLKSPSSKGWDSFKAANADTFAHDIQLKRQREENEARKQDEEPQDTDYRVPQRQMSTASDDSPDAMSKEIIGNQAEILLLAHKQLQDGAITHGQHQELIKNLGELMNIQKTMTELSSPECEAKKTKDAQPVNNPNVDDDLRNTSPRQDDSSRPRVTASPERPLERFKIPRRREGSPKKTTADTRGGLQNLYPELPSREQGPRSRQFPENDGRGEFADRRGPARCLDRGEPMEVESREKEWQPVSPDKATKRGEMPSQDPRDQGWRANLNRRGPGEPDRLAPPAEGDRRGPTEEVGIRGPPRRGPQGEFRRGPPEEFARRGPPEDMDRRRPIEEFSGPPGGFDRRPPPGEHENWGPSEEFDEGGASPEFQNRSPHQMEDRNDLRRQERFQRGPRGPLPERREDWNRGRPVGDRGPMEDLPEDHPDWRPPPKRRDPDGRWHGDDTQEPPGWDPRRRKNLDEGPWPRSPVDNMPPGPDGPMPAHWQNRPPGPPRHLGPQFREISPQRFPGPGGPRGPTPPPRFSGPSPQNSPYNEFPDHPPEEMEAPQELRKQTAEEDKKTDAKVFDPHRGLPPWKPVKKQSKAQSQAKQKKNNKAGPFSPWEPVKKEPVEAQQEEGPEDMGGSPGQGPPPDQSPPQREEPPQDQVPPEGQGPPPDQRLPQVQGPPPGQRPPPNQGPPPFRGPPPQQLQEGPPRLLREPNHRGSPGIDGPQPPPMPPHALRPEDEEEETRSHTAHLPAFLGPANPKPSRGFREEQPVRPVPLPLLDIEAKGPRPRMRGPQDPNIRGPRPLGPHMRGPSRPPGPQDPNIRGPSRPPFNGPRHLDGPHGRPGPISLLQEEPQNRLRGPPGPPPPQVDMYVDKNGDPRFRSFVDMSPEVSEEVVLGKKNFEIKLGAPPKRIQWGTEFIEVYADPSKRGVIVDGVLMYKFGERVKEVQIRGRKEKIFYHGRPLNLWIEGQNYEVRVDSPPKAIFIDSKPHRIQVDGRDMMILIDKEEKGRYGGPPRFIYIDGNRNEIRFDPPPRHILIDGKLCELKLNMAQPCVNIEGKLHGIRFDGPPREVFINGVLFQIFTDHAIKLRIGNRFHYVSLGGPCHELIIDGKWFEVKFTEQAKEVTLGNTVFFVQLPGPPPEVKILPELPRPPEPLMMPGPPRGLPMPGMPGMGPVMVTPGAGMPPMTAPGPMVLPTTTGIPMGPPRPGMPLPGVSQPLSLPSSVPGLFPGVPTMAPPQVPPILHPPPQPTAQSAVSAAAPAMDIKSLLARLVSTGMISKDQKPTPTPGTGPSASTAGAPQGKTGDKKDKPETILPQEYANIRKKTQAKEEKFDKIEDMTEMVLSRMKTILPAGAIQRMYAGVQCNSCGARFRLDDDEMTERYRQHLDWHFRQNKRDKLDTRMVRCRKWYYGISDWLQYEELGDTEEQVKTSLFEQQQQQQQQLSPTQPSAPHIALITVPEGSTVLKCPPATGDDNDDLCDICHEPFEQYWDEEHEQWHLRDAIRVNNKTYHPICYEDYTDVSEGTPSPSVLNITEPNFSGRKINYDESSQDGLPHSSFEEERDALTTEPSATSQSDSDIRVKLEPMLESTVDKDDSQPTDPVPAASYTAVTVKAEPEEPADTVVAVKTEPMETDAVRPEEEVTETAVSGPSETADVEPSSSYETDGKIPGFDIEPDIKPETSHVDIKPDIEPETSHVDIKPDIEPETSHVDIKPDLEPETSHVDIKPDLEPETSHEDTEPNVEPETLHEDTENIPVKTEESQPSAIDTDASNGPAEEEKEETTEEKVADASGEASGVDHLVTDNTQVQETVEEEDTASVEPEQEEPETCVEEEQQDKVSDDSEQPVSSDEEEEGSEMSCDTSETVPEVPEVGLYTPLTALSRVKLARPSDMSDISAEVLEIESNASTPTRDELPSPPSEEC